MKNCNSKCALGALALVGIAFAAKRMSDRRNSFKGIMDEFGIKGRTPFAFADKIREMDDEKYSEFKEKMKSQFASRCCTSHCRTEKTEA